MIMSLFSFRPVECFKMKNFNQKENFRNHWFVTWVIIVMYNFESMWYNNPEKNSDETSFSVDR